MDQLKNVSNEIPERFPFEKRNWKDLDMDKMMVEYQEKERLQALGMYAHVNWQWVRPLAKWLGERRVLEVMAGAGWLAKALRECGISVVATDDFSWGEKKGWQLQTEVEQLEASAAILKYGEECDILLISWPWMDADAYNALTKWNEVHPDGLIIYIGEYGGGCTADDDFHDHFEMVNDSGFGEVQAIYRHWDGMHDRIYLGKYSSLNVSGS